MPGVTLYQANSGNYHNDVSGSDQMSVSYTSDNVGGNIGIAWVAQPEGGEPTGGITDTNDNVWKGFEGDTEEDEYSIVYACTSLRPGPNVVSLNGCTPDGYGGPNLVIMEFSIPPCSCNNIGIQNFVADHQNRYIVPALDMTAMYSKSQGEWYHTLICMLYNNTNNDSNIHRAWTYIPDANAIDSATIWAFSDFSGNNTGSCGYSTVPYPHQSNFALFTYSPSPPIPDPDENMVIGLLITTSN